MTKKITFTYEEVRNNIREVFMILLNVKIDKNMETENVFGNKIGLKPRDLIYILFEIEKRFTIKIESEDLISGRFNTLTGISDIVWGYIEKEKCSVCPQ